MFLPSLQGHPLNRKKIALAPKNQGERRLTILLIRKLFLCLELQHKLSDIQNNTH